MKVAILGFGKEGRSLFAFLKKDKEYKRAEITILDSRENIEIPNGVRAKLGKNYLKEIEKFNVVFRSPGIRYFSPEIIKARKNGVIVSSATKLFFERSNAKIIGVTGTKGKGTTSTLIYKILKNAGKKVFIGGNIGTPAIDFLPKLTPDSWVVLELSSFQLIDLKQSPHVGVALMITSEHLDWHKDTREYIASKSNIVRFQQKSDIAVISDDYPNSKSYSKLTPARALSFSRRRPVSNGTSINEKGFWFSKNEKKEKICSTQDILIPGEHNWDNVAAAITVTKALGIRNSIIRKTIQNFKGLHHRLELIRTVRGVSYYNDSYSTTPETAEVAIKAFVAPKILILGGSGKGSDFRSLGKIISKSETIRAIIGIGAEWKRIKPHIKNSKINIIEDCKNMNEIIKTAKTISSPGDVVLLSPACASFGMFKNYTDRGMQFQEAVMGLR